MDEQTLINQAIEIGTSLRPGLTIDKIAREASMLQSVLSRARKHGGTERTLRKVIAAVARLTGRSLSVQVVLLPREQGTAKTRRKM